MSVVIEKMQSFREKLPGCGDICREGIRGAPLKIEDSLPTIRIGKYDITLRYKIVYSTTKKYGGEFELVIYMRVEEEEKDRLKRLFKKNNKEAFWSVVLYENDLNEKELRRLDSEIRCCILEYWFNILKGDKELSEDDTKKIEKCMNELDNFIRSYLTPRVSRYDCSGLY